MSTFGSDPLDCNLLSVLNCCSARLLSNKRPSLCYESTHSIEQKHKQNQILFERADTFKICICLQCCHNPTLGSWTVLCMYSS